MALNTQSTSLSEYLKTEYEPDAEFVDGVVEERAAGEYSHADWQFARSNVGHTEAGGADLNPKFRPASYVPGDRAVLKTSVLSMDWHYPIEQIVMHPPLAVFEVLSPEDTVQRLTRKLNDYHTIGIQESWMVDPETRVFSRFEAGQLSPCGSSSLRARQSAFPFKEIEALLD